MNETLSIFPTAKPLEPGEWLAMRCTALKPCGVKDCVTCGVWKR